MSKINIRKLYLYIAALLGLILIVIGGIRLVNLGLKAWVFTEADMNYRYPTVEKPMPVSTSTEVQEPTEEEVQEYEGKQRKSRRQREAAESLAFLIIGAPVYLYHWKRVQREEGN